jgi:lipoprotein-releasing system permease protein
MSLSLFVWIGVGGVFLGVAALMVVLAVMTGFQGGIRDKILAANPHVLVLDGSGRGIADYDAMAQEVSRVEGVKWATPFVLQQAMITLQGVGTGALIRGVDPSAPLVKHEVGSQMKQGSLSALSHAQGPPGIILGKELARNLGVLPGEVVTLISPQGAMTAAGLIPKMRRFTVVGITEVGMYEYDSTVAYMALPHAQEFAGLSERVTGIDVRLVDPFQAKGLAETIRSRLRGPYWVRNWMEMNRNLFSALQLEKFALFAILTIIVLVAAFAIIGHLVLLVAEKRKEIGILKAMGVSSGSIAAVFLFVGMLIGVVGTASGSLVGFGLIHLQNTYKIIRLAGDVYQIDALPMKLSTADFLLIVGAALVISFLATLYPARRAASLDPVEVLRYE